MTIYVATTPEGVTLQKKYRRYRKAIDRARAIMRRGFGLSVCLSGISLLLALFIFSYAPPERHQLGTFLLINVIVLFCLGLGLLMSNRFCAIFLVAYLTMQVFVFMAMGLFPLPLLLFAAVCIGVFSQTIAATNQYHKLTSKEQFFQAYLSGAEKLEVAVVGNIDLKDREVADSIPPLKSPAPAKPVTVKPLGSTSEKEQLIPCQDLIQLCNGDRNQATWLLSQLRAKDPHRSLEYYNAMAIGQIRDEISGILDRQ